MQQTVSLVSKEPKSDVGVSAAAAKSPQLCLTVCDPIDCSPPGSSVREILQARIQERVAVSSTLQGIFPTQGSHLDLLHCRSILYCRVPREAL